MAEHTRRDARIPYLPALDGLRAVALLTVLAFHGGFSVVHGGYLPLTAFFVLSGFLITALLLAERARTSSIDLGAFWQRRVRRLAPGALIGLALVAAYLAFGADRPAPGALGDALSSLFWVTNWRFIVTDQVYADAFSDPSPLQHYWSLAVEEQFYLVLPVLFGLLTGRGRRWVFGVAVASLTVASVVWTATLHEAGDPPLRAYFGTDTRAGELLIGVLLALALVDRRGQLRSFSDRTRPLLGAAGLLALGVSLVSWFVVEEYDDRLYEGGLAVVALVSAVVVTACTQPSTIVARLLAARPLVWIGRLSYGIYLFHWPLFLWIDEETTGLSTVPLFVLRMAVTTALAVVSWHLVETPVRHGVTPRWVGAVGWANASVAAAAVLAVSVAGAAQPTVTLDVGAQEGELPPLPPAAPDSEIAAPPSTSTTTTAPPSATASTTTAPPAGSPATTEPQAVRSGTAPPASVVAPSTTTTTTPPPTRILVVGDSIARNVFTGLDDWRADGASVALHDASIIGCPLSRGGVRHAQGRPWPVPESCGWWATSHLDEQLETFRPDLVLVQFGLNEIYDRDHPAWEGRQAPGDAGADAYIEAEWVAALERFAGSGARVVWTDVPCVDTSRTQYIDQELADTRSAVVNQRYLSAVTARGAAHLSLREELCPGGTYRDEVAGVADGRPDGIHLSDAAAAALARRWLGPELVSLAGR